MTAHADPWDIDANQCPPSATTDDLLAFLLGYAILAPSGHNTQPWLFKVVDGAVEVHADRTRGLPVVDPHDRALTISCGAAIGNLMVALRRFGHEPWVDLLPEPERADPDFLARISISGPHDPDQRERALFDAIVRRRTNREAYEPTPPGDDLLRDCQNLADGFGIELRTIADEPTKQALADLVAEGDRNQFADKRFRRELASWVHSRRLGSRDGMSGAGFGMPDVLSPVGALIIRTFDMGKGIAAGDRDKIVNGSPVLAVFATNDDEVSDWLRTGMALSHVVLALTAGGYTASYLNQPVEVDDLRPKLAKAVSLEGHPQLVMRFGRGPDIDPAVRRPVRDVLIA